MPFPVDWVDAFSDRPFGGNGCAVVHGGASLDDDTCKAFVRETSLVECTFTGPSDIADFRVRYFEVAHEIPFAGHPTVATVAALRHRGLIDDRVTLETGAGLVPVTVAQDGTITMTQVAPRFGAFADPALVAAAISVPADAFIVPPRVVSTGLPFVITVLDSKAAVDAAVLNLQALDVLARSLGGTVNQMEPFVVAREGATARGDTYARLFLAPPSPPEDPFTGSATGAMAAYLWSTGLMEKPVFMAEQGHGMGRPGWARVERVGPPEAMTGVRVGGQAFVLMSGDLHL